MEKRTIREVLERVLERDEVYCGLCGTAYWKMEPTAIGLFGDRVVGACSGCLNKIDPILALGIANIPPEVSEEDRERVRLRHPLAGVFQEDNALPPSILIARLGRGMVPK